MSVLFRPEMLRKWIGTGVKLPFQEGAVAMLPGPDGALTVNLVTRTSSTGGTHSLTAEGGAGMRFTITLTPGPLRDTSAVRITVGQLQEGMDVRKSLAFWQAALNRLTSIVHAIRRRRDSPKQALIVIHGIGEQQPGQTLREFVSAVFGDEHAPGWVKPDTLSGSFELRKVTVQAAPATEGREGRPTTDVYELYWAHLVRDSTVGQVLAWMKDLLLRRDVPPSLLPHVTVIRIVLLAAVLATIGLTVFGASHPQFVGGLVAGAGLMAVLAAVGGLLWRVGKPYGTKLLTGFLGDAARYFQPKPDNIARRQEIREAGVRLLERMHESGEYQRIVIAAHSLGSAIAYDILTFAWNRLRQQHEAPDSPGFSALRAVEKASEGGGKLVAIDAARGLQYAAWQEHRTNTQPWLVTDLVTMGSPLTHGNVLMADRENPFDSMVRDRMCPTCPPQLDTRKAMHGFSYAMPNRSTDGSKHDPFIIPDHAALFAFTRWTNLYFPFHGIIGGDPVGGPLKPLFGGWILDRPVAARKVGFMGFAHTRYWALDDRKGAYVGPNGEDHIECLREALDLHTAGRLRSVAAQRPAHTYL